MRANEDSVGLVLLDVALLVAATAWAISAIADGPFGPAMLLLLAAMRVLVAATGSSRTT